MWIYNAGLTLSHTHKNMKRVRVLAALAAFELAVLAESQSRDHDGHPDGTSPDPPDGSPGFNPSIGYGRYTDGYTSREWWEAQHNLHFDETGVHLFASVLTDRLDCDRSATAWGLVTNNICIRATADGSNTGFLSGGPAPDWSGGFTTDSNNGKCDADPRQYWEGTFGNGDDRGYGSGNDATADDEGKTRTDPVTQDKSVGATFGQVLGLSSGLTYPITLSMADGSADAHRIREHAEYTCFSACESVPATICSAASMNHNAGQNRYMCTWFANRIDGKAAPYFDTATDLSASTVNTGGTQTYIVCYTRGAFTHAPTLSPTTAAPTSLADRCDNQVQDADETDVDCGGSCASLGGAGLCDSGEGCLLNSDCFAATGSQLAAVNGADFAGDQFCDTDQTCALPSVQCHNGLFESAFETDQDCGGKCAGVNTAPNSGRCDVSGGCNDDSDCVYDICNPTFSLCGSEASACTDGTQNNQETDVDCGGAVCRGENEFCDAGEGCAVATDCVPSAHFCLAGACVVPPTMSPTPPPTFLVLPSEWRTVTQNNDNGVTTFGDLPCFAFKAGTDFAAAWNPATEKLFDIDSASIIDAEYVEGSSGKLRLSTIPNGQLLNEVSGDGSVGKGSNGWFFVTPTATDRTYDNACGLAGGKIPTFWDMVDADGIAEVGNSNCAGTSSGGFLDDRCRNSITPMEFEIDSSCWEDRVQKFETIPIASGSITAFVEETKFAIHMVQCGPGCNVAGCLTAQCDEGMGNALFNSWRKIAATRDTAGVDSNLDYTGSDNILNDNFNFTTWIADKLHDEADNPNNGITATWGASRCVPWDESVVVTWQLPSVTSTIVDFTINYVYFPLSAETSDPHHVIVDEDDNGNVALSILNSHLNMEMCYHTPRRDPSGYQPYTHQKCVEDDLYLADDGYLWAGQPFRFKFKFQGEVLGNLAAGQDFNIDDVDVSLASSLNPSSPIANFDVTPEWHEDQSTNEFWVYGILGDYQSSVFTDNNHCINEYCILTMALDINITATTQRRLLSVRREFNVGGRRLQNAGEAINPSAADYPAMSIAVYQPQWVMHTVKLYGAALPSDILTALRACMFGTVPDPNSDVTMVGEGTPENEFVFEVAAAHVYKAAVRTAYEGCFQTSVLANSNWNSSSVTTSTEDDANKIVIVSVLGGCTALVIVTLIYVVYRHPAAPSRPEEADNPLLKQKQPSAPEAGPEDTKFAAPFVGGRLRFKRMTNADGLV